MELSEIQARLSDYGADAWILVDYENRNQAMVRLLGKRMLTRKIFMVLPKLGRPYLITHIIDTVYLQDESITAKFDQKVYKTWQEMLALQRNCFANYQKVLMDVSESGLLPRVSLADYGTVEFIKGMGIEVASSADLLQHLTSVFHDPQAMKSHLEGSALLQKIKDEAFRKIALDVRSKGESDEYEIQQFITRRFQEEGYYYDEAPIVAIGPNASNPHYAPTKDVHSPIHEGDLVLIDMWAKSKIEGSVYVDITWMGYVGHHIPEEYAKRFAIIATARDAAIAFIKQNHPHRPVRGYEADDVARDVVEKAGYGEYFTHRLGHSIFDDDSPHGPGANLDNYETHDTRFLLPGTSFSVEPGIYAPDFGMRTETDVHLDEKEVTIIGGLQKEIIAIMSLA